MKRVGLYGGAFDPPHIGHVMSITAVWNSGRVDEVWLIPTGRHRFKQGITAGEHRRIMVEIMLATAFVSAGPLRVNTTELERLEVPSTTIELLALLRARHADCAFSLIIGADLIEQIPSWARGEELMATASFLVVPRLGQVIPGALPPTMHIVPSQHHTDVSSSIVREMIAGGRSVDGLVPPGVIAYILRNKLYKNDE